ncbi:GntR family transcriptional regulator [Longimycelium tulufanense]|uniref:GntR family transcriptional regulator n=1 Tax=Longimycelium tulufanense TaxID=907463 RepID=A0A8J3FWU1_9PSEU|nr:GntR family transcriptional regulator [Longimycelium tulufanense]GGM80383.1 GntR family transcriptional regulator [Longimycelium tulufanense]
MPTIERAEPPYLQVVRHIREQIKSGALKDGDPVPSAREIARTWGVALATATKALTTLRAEGLTRGVSGVGTIVQTKGALHHSAQDRSIAMHRTGKIYPPGHYAKIRTAALSPTPTHVADALGIREGTPAIRRQRTTYRADDTPISTSVSWFDGTLVAGAPLLLSTERIVQGTARYIEEQTGRLAVMTYVQHAAGFAAEDDAVELRIPVGSAVLMSRNRFVDTEGAVLEYGESTALPGHWVFYEYTNEEAE